MTWTNHEELLTLKFCLSLGRLVSVEVKHFTNRPKINLVRSFLKKAQNTLLGWHNITVADFEVGRRDLHCKYANFQRNHHLTVDEMSCDIFQRSLGVGGAAEPISDSPDHERPATRSVVFVKALDQVSTEGAMTSRSREATSTKNSDNVENCARRT
jgi:hypothetical protein